MCDSHWVILCCWRNVLIYELFKHLFSRRSGPGWSSLAAVGLLNLWINHLRSCLYFKIRARVCVCVCVCVCVLVPLVVFPRMSVYVSAQGASLSLSLVCRSNTRPQYNSVRQFLILSSSETHTQRITALIVSSKPRLNYNLSVSLSLCLSPTYWIKTIVCPKTCTE